MPGSEKSILYYNHVPPCLQEYPFLVTFDGLKVQWFRINLGQYNYFQVTACSWKRTQVIIPHSNGETKKGLDTYELDENISDQIDVANVLVGLHNNSKII